MFQPTHYTIVSGIGKSEYALLAFDNALRDAGIGDYNLVKVSSILPPNCKYKKEIPIGKGSIIFTAYATITLKENEKGMTAVATAIPVNIADNGVIFEHSTTLNVNAEDMVKEMAKQAMENRNKKYKEIIATSKTAKGEKGKYVSLISAIAMW